MHSKIFGINKERIGKFLKDCEEQIDREYIPMEAVYACTKDPVPFKDRLKLKYKAIKEGERWGEDWESGWFKVTVTIPKEFAGRELAMLLNFGGEGMVYDKTGCPVYGLTGGTIYSWTFAKSRYVIGKHKAGEKLELWVETAANHLFGIDRSKEHPFGHFVGSVRANRLCVFDRELWSMLLDMNMLFDQINYMGEKNYRSMKLMELLMHVVDIYNYDPAMAPAARAVLKEYYETHPALASALTACTIGHAHIDVGWMWPVRESIRKAGRTFSSQIANIEKYPEYKFGASQAELYNMVKTNYPALFKKIQKYVAEKRWEIQGGMWVEADCNLTSGESLVRQFLHGKNFFMDEFGVDVKNLWIPDVFGYAASLPQIMKKSGCDYFLTQKISWSQVNGFPYKTFRWQGVDGTEVITHFPPEDTYNASCFSGERMMAQDAFPEAGFLDEFMSLCGIGDGGGGPAEEHIERALRMSNLEGVPKNQFCFASDFFDRLSTRSEELPTWVGELYLEYHRGTLTTQAATKRNNRKCEQNLTALEYMWSCLPVAKYPAKDLDFMWKKVLLNQFHDILPGSSIDLVYKVTKQEHAAVLAKAAELMDKAASLLFTADKNSAVLTNTLSYPWTGTVALPESWKGCSVKTGNQTVPVQSENGVTTALVTVPAGSFLTLTKFKKTPSSAVVKGKKDLVLENDFVRYEFSKDGALVTAFDKTAGREMLSAPANIWSVYNDQPRTYDAWDIEIYYPRDFIQNITCSSAKKVLDGDVRSVIEFTYQYGKSEFVQRAVLGKNSARLDFETEGEWHEDHKLIRTAFPVDVPQGQAAFDIQYAYLKRETHDNTSWDQAKFEVCGQRYADLSNAQFGAALLNDCKYGYRVKNGSLELSLLRSPKEPDFSADMGHHVFTYSFLPHAGSLTESTVMREAACLNRAPHFADGYAAGKAEAPFAFESDGITLEVVKKAEKSNALILRFVETKGRLSKGILTVRNPKAKLSGTNLVEWEKGEALPLAKSKLNLTLKPFEIRTIRVD